jgi:hypothetical protein
VKGNSCPFQAVFKKLPPSDFVQALKGEADQTKAFILSFARSGEYIDKVLELEENDGFLTVFFQYCAEAGEESPDPDFVKKVEGYLESKISCGKRQLRRNKYIGDTNGLGAGEEHTGKAATQQAEL